MTVIIIAPLGAPEKRVRLAKAIGVLRDQVGVGIAFWGWRRAPSDQLGLGIEGIVESRALLTGGGFRSAKTRLLYLVWSWRVFWALMWSAPPRVYCLGLETALPAWLASRVRRRIRFVFDDADRLVMVWKLPRTLDLLIRWLERRVSTAAIAHIIPCVELYDYQTSQMRLVRNMPDRAQVAKAKQADEEKDPGVLTVYVNGVLDATRNLQAIAQAARLLMQKDEARILFLTATPRDIENKGDFEGLQNVRHLGWLPQVESLAKYQASDVVLSFCDTQAVASYRFAWPNKWGDAITMGTPIIVNADMVTARSLIDAGAAFACPCGDPQALVDLLIGLQLDPERLEGSKRAIERIRPEYQYFDDAMLPILTKLTAEV